MPQPVEGNLVAETLSQTAELVAHLIRSPRFAQFTRKHQTVINPDVLQLSRLLFLIGKMLADCIHRHPAQC